MYEITEWTKKRAKDLGYKVKPSTNKQKKIDVFRDGKKVGTVGAKNYGDYGTYLKTHGKQFADSKRKGYLARTEWCNKPESNCYLARSLLW